MAVTTVSDDVDDVSIYGSSSELPPPALVDRAAMTVKIKVWSQMFDELVEPLVFDVGLFHTAEAVKISCQQYSWWKLNITISRMENHSRRGPLMWRAEDQFSGVSTLEAGWKDGVEIVFHTRIDTRPVVINTLDGTPALDSGPDASRAVETALVAT